MGPHGANQPSPNGHPGRRPSPPGVSIFPGLALTTTVLAVYFFGDGLRDLLDPRLRL